MTYPHAFFVQRSPSQYTLLESNRKSMRSLYLDVASSGYSCFGFAFDLTM